MFDLGKAKEILDLVKAGQEIYNEAEKSGKFQEYLGRFLKILGALKTLGDELHGFEEEFGHDLPAMKSSLLEHFPHLEELLHKK